MSSRGAMFAQAARGPVLLITIGILFALQQAGYLPFSRSWPLLIIVIGVMKLIERLFLGSQPVQLPQAAYPQQPPRAPVVPPPPPGSSFR